MNTPNPLTAAIEAAEKEFEAHPAIKAANDAIVLQALRSGTSGYQGTQIGEFIREKMEQAYALGMDAGAKSVSEPIHKVLIGFDTINRSADELFDLVVGALDAARTAHKV